MSRFERGGELAGQEMYGGVGEQGELCVGLCYTRYKILFIPWLSSTLCLLVDTEERNEQALCQNRDTTPPTTRLNCLLPRMH